MSHTAAVGRALNEVLAKAESQNQRCSLMALSTFRAAEALAKELDPAYAAEYLRSLADSLTTGPRRMMEERG